MIYTPAQRVTIIQQSVGKTIQSLEYDEEGRYWVMTFTDGLETCFRFMAEIGE